MSYATKYRFAFDSHAGTDFRIEIQKDGYSGAALSRPLGQPPHLRRESGDNGIFGTSLELHAHCVVDGEFAELYTSNAREFRVLLQRKAGSNWTTIWSGFVSPELYSAPDIAPPYDVRIIAVDGLGELKIYDFPASGRQSLLTHLRTILAHTGLDTLATDILCVSSLRGTSPTIPAATMLAGTFVSLDHLADGNCYDALQAILRTLHMSITRQQNRWLLVRDSDAEITGGVLETRTASGAAAPLPVPQYGDIRAFAWWPVGRTETEIVPARKRVAVGYPYRVVASLFKNPETANPYCGTYMPPGADDCPHWESVGGTKTYEGGSLFYGNHALVGKIQQTVNVEAQGSYASNAPLLLELKIAGVGLLSGPAQEKIRVKAFVTSGSTVLYLKKKKKGTGETDLEWTSADSYFELTVPVEYHTPGGTALSRSHSEFSITIPYILAGSFTLQFDGTQADERVRFQIGGAFLTRPTIAGYQDIISIDNAAREAEQDTELAFGDAPYTENALANIHNVLSDASGNLSSAWATAKFTGEFLSVIAMDYALTVAQPRLQTRGTLNVPQNADIPPAFVSPGGNLMLLQTWDWNLLHDDLQVVMLSTPTAAIAIDEHALTQLTPEQAQAYTGGKPAGSVGSGNFGGTSIGYNRFFEAVEENTETVGAKALYDLHIIQEGTGEPESPEITKNISAILRHLSLHVLGAGTTDEQTVLVSDITIASARNIIAGGIGDAAPAAGGGSIATLTDVALAALADGDILQYDALTTHWVNRQLTLSLLADVLTDGAENNQVLSYNAATGKWAPRTLPVGEGGGIGSIALTMPTGFAVTGSPLTADGEINVSFTPGYSLPTTQQQQQWLTSAALSGYATQSWVNAKGYITSAALSGYATQAWVEGKNYITSAALSGYATQSWVNAKGYITAAALSGYATQAWVEGKNYITSAALSGYATQAWVEDKNYLTAAALSGYATQSWVNAKGYITAAAVEAYIADQGFATQAWVNAKGYITAITASMVTTALGDTPVARATADASGNTITTSYLRKNIDDTMAANLTVGTSAAPKTISLRGNTSAALHIYGGSNLTSIYRDASWLRISSSIYVAGNIVATGNVTAGQASDRRLKSHIRRISLDDAEEVLSALRPVSWQWNETAAELGQFSGVSRGFVADEYLRVIPGAGRKIWGDYDAIDSLQAVPFLVAGWQQQNLRIRILEGEISALKADIQTLQRRIAE